MSEKNIARHLRKHEIDPLHPIRDKIREDERKFKETKDIGEALRSEIIRKSIDPACLRREYKQAVNLDTNTEDMSHITLKLWQSKLLGDLVPTDRSIYWIIGKQGAEGKTWFQKFLTEYLGHFRVYSTTIDKRSDGILHALTKRNFSLVDVFLFNIPRSFNEQEIPYTLLEDIKDGYSLSTKYDSKQIKFRTPNIVVIFSNKEPYRPAMSEDRWNVYHIVGDSLKAELNV